MTVTAVRSDRGPVRRASGPDPVRTLVILVAHGSPDPRHAESVRRTAARLARRTSAAVTAAFLEHDVPQVSSALAQPRPADLTPHPEHVIVLPLLLTAGFHWRNDIPPVLSHHGRTAQLIAPPEPAHFAPLIARACGGAGHVVLASAGSSRPEIVDRFAALAAALRGDHAVREVSVALTPGAVADHARPDSVVVPVLTADGIFADRIRSAAAGRGAAVTPVLGDSPGFADCLARLIRVVG